MGEGSIPKLKQWIHNLKPRIAPDTMQSYYAEQTMVSLVHESIRETENNYYISFVTDTSPADQSDAFQKVHNNTRSKPQNSCKNKNLSLFLEKIISNLAVCEIASIN